MKKHLPIYFLLSLLFMVSGCKKEKFDFSRLNQISANGEWGISILNDTYTIEDILAQLEDNDYLFQDANGQLFLNYIFDEREIVTDSMILSFSNASSSYRWREVVSGIAGSIMSKDTTFLFKIPDDNIVVRKGTVMYGYLNLGISGNTGTVIISSQSLKDASGKNFVRNISGNYQERVDLSGYKLSFSYENANKIVLDVHITYQGTGTMKEYSMNMNVSSHNLRLREATGKIKSFTGRYKDRLNIGETLNRNHYGGSLTLYNPKVTLHVKNGFHQLRGFVFIDSLHFTGKNKPSDILTAYPSQIQILEGMDAEQNVEGLSSVYYSSDFNRLRFTGRIIVNPQGLDAGEKDIRENSSLDITANIAIPFELKSDYLYYQDTVDFNIGDSINISQRLQNIAFRYVIGNGLPFNVNTQIYFYNSKQKTLVDSLFHPSLPLFGAFQGKMTETAAILEIEQNRIDKVLNANKIILCFKINTEGRKVFVDAKQGLKVLLSAKVKGDFEDIFGIFH